MPYIEIDIIGRLAGVGIDNLVIDEEGDALLFLPRVATNELSLDV